MEFGLEVTRSSTALSRQQSMTNQDSPDLEPPLTVLRPRNEHDTRAKIHAFAEAHGLSPAELYNALSREVARRFLDGGMTFEDADAIANTLYSIMVEDALAEGDDFEFAEPAFGIFLAFDDGEWDRGDGIDPVERYTTPGLRELLGRHPGTP